MRFHMLAWIAALVSMCATAAFAADVNGKWTAEMRGPGGQTRTVTFEFKAEGETLTGTMSGPRGDREISEGKISGDEISFSMVFEREGAQMKMLYKGKVSGDEIQFSVQREGADRSFEFTAKRAGG